MQIPDGAKVNQPGHVINKTNNLGSMTCLCVYVCMFVCA